MENVIEWLKEHGGLKVIDEPLDVELEIPHLAYLEVKKGSASRPLLFTRPVWRAKGIEYEMPVLMNIFANYELTQKILGRHPDAIAEGIEALMKFKPPRTLSEKLAALPRLLALKNVFPKRLKGRGACQEIVLTKEEVDLDRLPILKTWPEDGGRFITMGQVYTRSLDGSTQNLGMYRLQQYDKRRLGMHWQIQRCEPLLRPVSRRRSADARKRGDRRGSPLYLVRPGAHAPRDVRVAAVWFHSRQKRPPGPIA